MNLYLEMLIIVQICSEKKNYKQQTYTKIITINSK